MRFSALPVAIAALWLAVGSPAAWASPLTGGRPAVPTEAATTMALLPDPLRGVVQGINRVQADLSRRMTGQLQQVRDRGSVAVTAWLCLIAFVYGVLHAAGPGHGKLVVASYFLGRRARIVHGVTLAFGAAMIQAMAALLLVGIPVMALDMTRATALGGLRFLEAGSYGLMVVVGLLLLVRAARGTPCCSHGPGPNRHEASGGHDSHDPHHNGCGCDHREDRHAPGPASNPAGFRLLTLAVGCRPCSGAVLVLLFALANDIVPAGVAAVLAMAVGVALTTSATGLIGIGTRFGLEAVLGAHPRWAALAGRGLALAGALLITLIGGLLFLASLNGL